ncbi:hypothetical protein ASPTUDRAFT_223166 [Aspergillus tubingensis CBS 134.48]|uniref:Uncharacterized protein n=1 Tax=Aspergillus tubingensis (strain CBS 134.48) TaxID=767770 RepID=A0A1L9NLS6_ASPTC|nr:hypothetical protein ASPTUDRAFT_223166 [Aspergillus tubingensis CBS 134.48]
MTAFRGQQSRWLPTFPPQMRHHVSRSQAAFQIGPDFIWADCQPAGRKENRSHPSFQFCPLLPTDSIDCQNIPPNSISSPLAPSQLRPRRSQKYLDPSLPPPSLPQSHSSSPDLPSCLLSSPPTRLSFPVRHMG